MNCWLCEVTTTTSAAMAWHIRLIHYATRPVRRAVDSLERNQGLLKLFAEGDSK